MYVCMYVCICLCFENTLCLLYLFILSMYPQYECLRGVVETCAPPLPQVTHPQLSHRDVFIDMLHKTRVLTVGKLLSHLKGAVIALGQVCTCYSALL